MAVNSRENIDGLRTLAVLLVLMVHAGFPGADAGFVGVDIFFVLSGFLITTILMKESATSSAIHYTSFLRRRVIRLLPVYYGYMLFITVLLKAGIGHTSIHGGWTPDEYLAAYWLFAGNIVPLGGIWEYQSLTVHLWFVSVAVQFYIIWPIFLKMIPNKKWRIYLVWSGVGLLMIFLRYCSHAPSPGLIYTRGIGLFIGAAFALSYPLVAVALPFKHLVTNRALSVALFVALLLFVMMSVAARTGVVVAHKESYAITRLWLPFFDFAVGSVIINLWSNQSSLLAKVLSWKPLSYLGKRSYGIYMYHMAAHMLVWNFLLKDIEHWNQFIKYGLRFSLFLMITVALAVLSYRYYEQPLNKLKKS